MDGNGRWAKARNLPRTAGHKAGVNRLYEIFDECRDQGIKVISLYAFSTENWNRPKGEISKLFSYLEAYLKKNTKKAINNGTKYIVSGDYSKLPLSTVKEIEKSIELTKFGKNFTINLCLNYGGKSELVRAAKLFASDVVNGKDISSLSEETFNDYLYTKGLPPVDLLIRTSGEKRTSNFLPYQLTYAEMMFPSTPWPDFTKEKLRECIDEYYHRDRRFGGIYEEGK